MIERHVTLGNVTNSLERSAQLMIINTNQFSGNAVITKVGGVDFDSRSAPAHR
jgi:hypothetical protein